MTHIRKSFPSNPLLARINLSMILYGMTYSTAWCQEGIEEKLKSQNIVEKLADRAQISLQDINQGAQLGLFKGIRPLWIYGEGDTKGFSGFSAGLRGGLGHHPKYWGGVYSYFPCKGFQLPIWGLMVFGLEAGNRWWQGALNVGPAFKSLQVTAYCFELKGLGFQFLPSIEIGHDNKYSYNNGYACFGKVSMTLPNILRAWILEGKYGYGMQEGSKWSVGVKTACDMSSGSQPTWLRRQLNTTPYLSTKRLAHKNPSTLVEAVRDNNPKAVQLFLKDNGNLQKDIDKQAKQDERANAFVTAAQLGYSQVVKIFLETGEKVNIRNEEGNPPLLEASKNNHVQVVKLLLEAGAGNEIKWRGTALVEASKNNHAQVVKLLLEVGADDNNKSGSTVLREAKAKNNKTYTLLLLDKAISKIRGHCTQALVAAATRGHKDIIDLLAGYPINLNEKDPEEKTALVEAANNGHYHTIQSLITHGATVTSNALVAASRYGHCQVVELLLGSNPSLIHQQDSSGNIALIEASAAGQLEVFDLLLEKGADFNKQDKKGNTPLLIASKYGKVDIVMPLLDRNVEVNTKNNEGKTALFVAIESENQENRTKIVKHLIEKDAHLRIKDKQNNTLLHVAAVHENSEDIITSLLQKGLNISARNKEGRTPLSLANIHGRAENATLLEDQQID